MKLPLALLLLASLSSGAHAQHLQEMAGDRYRITVTYESESEGGGSSSNSNGRYAYLEQIVAVRPDGTERIYDLPFDPSDQARLINWHFPVRVFQDNDGGVQLLNREELEARRDAWLEAADISPEACGSWYFTWSAFQVECDPDSILAILESIDIQPPSLSNGELIQHPAALNPGRLSLDSSDGDGQTYRAQMTVDPDFVRREKAQADVILGEIMGEPVSFDDAYVARRNEQISGVLEVIFEARPDGRVWRRVTSTEIERTEADGQAERQISREVVEREALRLH